MSAPRRRAREYALMMTAGMEKTGQTADKALALFDGFFDQERPADPPPAYAPHLPPGYVFDRKRDEGTDTMSYAERLVRGVFVHRAELDTRLEEVSQHWRLARMGWVDRNLLRLGAYEIRFEPTVPREVIIDEAVELAKSFGSAESPAFINGILDKIKREA